MPTRNREPMNRGATIIWFTLLLGAVTTELAAIFQRRPGDTLSEHVWKLMTAAPGAVIFALGYWCFVWHFPFGHGRRLGWQDVCAVALGLLMWLIARNNAR